MSNVVSYEDFKKLKSYKADVKWMMEEDKERYETCIAMEMKLYKDLVANL